MIMDQYFKFVLTFIGVGLCLISFKLWLLPEKASAEDIDIDIKNRLSYISKVVGAIESSAIKLEGDLRFVKRQAEISALARDIHEKRLSILENKITNMMSLIDSIEMDLSEMDGNIFHIESDLDDLTSGSCDNIFLCRQKKY